MSNEILRDDGPTDELMRPATRFTRALNAFCVTDDSRGQVSARWPENNRTYRGAVLPRGYQAFYRVGKKYRVPMFLATSFGRSVAVTFIKRSLKNADDKDEPVMYTFELDPRDKCMHVNYLETHEREFLFAPYSAFRVKAATWQARPTLEHPHTITLEVASDNRDKEKWPLELPLAPWA